MHDHDMPGWAELVALCFAGLDLQHCRPSLPLSLHGSACGTLLCHPRLYHQPCQALLCPQTHRTRY